MRTYEFTVQVQAPESIPESDVGNLLSSVISNGMNAANQESTDPAMDVDAKRRAEQVGTLTITVK
jgi:hypothetical protein